MFVLQVEMAFDSRNRQELEYIHDRLREFASRFHAAHFSIRVDAMGHRHSYPMMSDPGHSHYNEARGRGITGGPNPEQVQMIHKDEILRYLEEPGKPEEPEDFIDDTEMEL